MPEQAESYYLHVKTAISDIEMKEMAESEQLLELHDNSDIDMHDMETGDYFCFLFPLSILDVCFQLLSFCMDLNVKL